MKKILGLIIVWLVLNFALLINSTNSFIERKGILSTLIDTKRTYRYNIKWVGNDIAIKDRWTDNGISEFFLVNTLKIYYKSFSEHNVKEVYVNEDKLVIIDFVTYNIR